MAKRIIALVLAMLMAVSAQAATVYGSLPDDGIYVAQTEKHTCTLVAATMMLRNHAFLYGGDYADISVKAVKKPGWSDRGLSHSFKLNGAAVTHNADISQAKDKKQYLIDQLIEHPEGIVIYNSKQPHAVFLFGYRADTDLFFCADTTGENSLRMITLSDTLLKGEGQQGKINGITRIWHIK